jgi:hypothetical protein
MSSGFPVNFSCLSFIPLGDLIFLSILGRNILVCNSRETVMDILHKRGANSADRPRMPILERW